MDKSIWKNFFTPAPAPENVVYNVIKDYWAAGKWAENISVLDGPDRSDVSYDMRRSLGDDLSPSTDPWIDIFQSPTASDERVRTYLAAPGELPCAKDFYTQDMSSFHKECANCYPSANSSHLCGGYSDIYTGNEAEHVTDQFQTIVTSLARFYADALGDVIKSRGYDVEVKTRYFLDDHGELNGKKTIVYNNYYAEGRNSKYKQWRLAQTCSASEPALMVLKNGAAPKPNEYVLAKECFENKAHCDDGGCGGVVVDFTRPKYDATLVGTPEPLRLADIKEMSVTGDAQSGLAEAVSVTWLGASGNFEVPNSEDYSNGNYRRSPYLAGILNYFDPLLYQHGASNYQYTVAIEGVEVKVRKGDKVPKNGALFTYQRPSGEVVTIRSEVSGKITELGDGGNIKWLMVNVD